MTYPPQAITGGGQTLAAFIAGERDLDDLGRAFVNGPSTTFDQGLALMGGGNISYNDDHGIWVSEDTVSWTSGRGGTTYGNIFVTPQIRQDVVADPASYPRGWDGLLGHEEVHSDQWARWGGGALFGGLYQLEEHVLSGGGSDNRFEQEAGLREGGY